MRRGSIRLRGCVPPVLGSSLKARSEVWRSSSAQAGKVFGLALLLQGAAIGRVGDHLERPFFEHLARALEQVIARAVGRRPRLAHLVVQRPRAGSDGTGCPPQGAARLPAAPHGLGRRYDLAGSAADLQLPLVQPRQPGQVPLRRWLRRLLLLLRGGWRRRRLRLQAFIVEHPAVARARSSTVSATLTSPEHLPERKTQSTDPKRHLTPRRTR